MVGLVLEGIDDHAGSRCVSPLRPCRHELDSDERALGMSDRTPSWPETSLLGSPGIDSSNGQQAKLRRSSGWRCLPGTRSLQQEI
jgi:hypothetical protein